MRGRGLTVVVDPSGVLIVQFVGSRFRHFLPELTSGDDGRQMGALLELSDALSLATEDSLLGFELDSFVPALINLLNAEHNPDIMRTPFKTICCCFQCLTTRVCATCVYV